MTGRQFRCAARLAPRLGLAGLIWLAGMAGPALAAGSKSAEPAAPIEPLPVAKRGLPVELLRTLQLLQDRIARGGTQAHLAQRPLLGHIEGRLTALEPEAWGEAANVRAAVAFALAGGGPALLRLVAETGRVPEAEVPLVQGALAYLGGQEAEARRLLAKIDAQAVPPSLGGQLALVQATLVVRDDPTQAVRLLDLARLIAPGTLVEEGALRREVFVLAQMGDIARFEALSIQYLRRFRHSVYAGNFRQRFAAALTRLEFGNDRARFARLEAMLKEIEPEGRRDLYLLVARAALDQGRTGAAIFAADQAEILAPGGSVEAARAKLYRAAAGIVAPERFAGALAALRGTDRAALPDTDAALLDAALAAARQIRGDPPPAPAAPPEAPADTKRALPPAPAIARAQEAIGRIDAMMQGARR